MSRNDANCKRQITALTNEEYSALEDAAEWDMRGEADHARYLIVEGLRRRKLLHDYSAGQIPRLRNTITLESLRPYKLLAYREKSVLMGWLDNYSSPSSLSLSCSSESL